MIVLATGKEGVGRGLGPFVRAATQTWDVAIPSRTGGIKWTIKRAAVKNVVFVIEGGEVCCTCRRKQGDVDEN